MFWVIKTVPAWSWKLTLFPLITLCVSSLLQDSSDDIEDVSLFDADDDVSRRSKKSKIRSVAMEFSNEFQAEAKRRKDCCVISSYAIYLLFGISYLAATESNFWVIESASSRSSVGMCRSVPSCSWVPSHLMCVCVPVWKESTQISYVTGGSPWVEGWFWASLLSPSHCFFLCFVLPCCLPCSGVVGPAASFLVLPCLLPQSSVRTHVLGSVLHVSDLEIAEMRQKGRSAVLRNVIFLSEVFPLSEPF